MPYPAQTDREQIVATAYQLIEQNGIEQLALVQLAEALHIKAPSLYRHIPNKATLIQLVNERTIAMLAAAYRQVLLEQPAVPIEQLRALCHAHRAFAHAHPATYILAFTTAAPNERPSADLLEALALPLQELIATLSGSSNGLAALRGALALIHGFVMLELYNQLRRDGDLTLAFHLSIEAYLRGWQFTNVMQ